MTASGAALLFATGAAVGLLSGLTGIGGGVLMVPLLYAYYGATVSADSVPVVAAHATSLAVIAPTALVGAWRYGRGGVVAWRVAAAMGAGAAATAALFALTAVRVPGDVLRGGFAAFLLAVAWSFVRPGRAPHDGEGGRAAAGPAGLAVAGGTVGAMSALLGVGGGVVAIPLLQSVARLPLRQIAPTSLAVIAPAAAAGALVYSLTPAAGMPPWSVGLVHAGAALPLLVGSLVFVGPGTRLHARVPDRALRLGFAALLFAAAFRLLWVIARG